MTGKTPFDAIPEDLHYSQAQIKERIEGMEDPMELRTAVERNAGKPGVPREQVKTELEID